MCKYISYYLGILRKNKVIQIYLQGICLVKVKGKGISFSIHVQKYNIKPFARNQAGVQHSSTYCNSNINKLSKQVINVK